MHARTMSTVSQDTSTIGLLEREDEQSAIHEAVDAVMAGSGRVLLLEGEAGIGKTELLGVARRRAEGRGMRVLRARGGPLEAEFAFGVVRQLFEAEVRGLRPEERDVVLDGAAAGGAAVVGVDAPLADPARLDLLRVLHGVYCLCSNLSERSRLSLEVDDAHAADPESLRWLNYMAQRVEDLPLLVIVAARPGEQSADPISATALASLPATSV